MDYMDRVNREIKWLVVIIIILSVGVVLWFMWLFHGLESAENSAKAYVGKQVVIEQDTSVIVDYSMWKSSFTLSSGKEISFEFAEKYALNK